MNILQKMKSIPFLLRLIILYALNISDWLLTLLLVSTDYFTEANPFMTYTIDSVFLGVILKCVLPFILLGFLGIRLIKANKKQLTIARISIGVMLWLYLIINIMHIFWLILSITLSLMY